MFQSLKGFGIDFDYRFNLANTSKAFVSIPERVWYRFRFQSMEQKCRGMLFQSLKGFGIDFDHRVFRYYDWQLTGFNP